MLVRLLGAELLGELARFRLPNSKQSQNEFAIVKNPDVHISRQAMPEVESRQRWGEFLAKCIRFEPDHRFESASALGVELDELLREHPILGDLEVVAHGRLQLCQSDGKTRVARVVRDYRPH